MGSRERSQPVSRSIKFPRPRKITRQSPFEAYSQEPLARAIKLLRPFTRQNKLACSILPSPFRDHTETVPDSFGTRPVPKPPSRAITRPNKLVCSILLPLILRHRQHLPTNNPKWQLINQPLKLSSRRSTASAPLTFQLQLVTPLALVLPLVLPLFLPLVTTHPRDTSRLLSARQHQLSMVKKLSTQVP